MINPIYPIEDIGSVDELMSIAVGMEHEAAMRYQQLAERMDRRGDAQLAALFRRLSELERAHEDGIGRWAEREGLRRPLPAAFAWRMPETFGDEDDYALTPYRALSIAVRNEERAFTFYSYLAAMAPDSVVRARAEALAREELNHVAQLRMQRRRAFHMDRPPPRSALRARSVEELQRLAEGFDATSARIEQALASSDDRETQSLALREADEMADAYMAVAEQAEDEAVMRKAQEFAEQALGRAAVLRTLIDHRERSEHP